LGTRWIDEAPAFLARQIVDEIMTVRPERVDAPEPQAAFARASRFHVAATG